MQRVGQQLTQTLAVPAGLCLSDQGGHWRMPLKDLPGLLSPEPLVLRKELRSPKLWAV